MMFSKAVSSVLLLPEGLKVSWFICAFGFEYCQVVRV